MMSSIDRSTKILMSGLGLVLLLLTVHTWHDPDIWYHINIARAIWHQGTFDPSLPFLLQQEGFVNFYWLFESICYFLFRAGNVYAVQGFFSLTWLTMGLLWARSIQLHHSGAWGLWLGTLALAVVQTRFVLRPDIPLMLFLFAQALLMNQIFVQKAWAWPPVVGILFLQVLAANFQTYFILGPALAAVLLLAESLRLRNIHWKSLSLFLAMMVASCFSPHGFNNWVLIFHYFSIMGQLNSVLMELGMPMARHFFEWAYWLFLAITLLLILRALRQMRSGRLPNFLFALLLAGMGCALSVLAARNVPFVVLFSAPLYGQLLPKRKLSRLEVCALGVVLATFIWGITSNQFYEYMHVSRRFGVGVTKQLQPIEFTNWLEQQHLGPTRIFNEPNFGGYLAWQFPEQKWFSDSRYVQAEKILAYFATLNDKAKFDVVAKAYQIEGVLLSKAYSVNLAPALWNDPNWRPIYQDELVAFLVRSKAGGDGDHGL